MPRTSSCKAFTGSLLGLTIWAVGCAAPAPSAEVEPQLVSVERQIALMGTDFSIFIEAKNRSLALQASEIALRSLEKTEQRLSTWTEQSELSLLNQKLQRQAILSGDAVQAGLPTGSTMSSALATELAQAQHWNELTDGAFEPRLGALIQAWDLRGQGRTPSTTEITQALANKTIWEEGGFGKGAGLDAALQALQDSEASRARLDLGGQIAVFGAGPFLIDVAHPSQRQTALARLRIDSGSVATSGNSERGLLIDGQRIGHLLDPRSGRPAPDFGSLTVWASTAMAADCLSTGLYVMGPDAALQWAQSHPGIEVLVLEKLPSASHPTRLRARASSGLQSRLTILDASVQVEFQTRIP
jgi:FAD:protein FMN transferase